MLSSWLRSVTEPQLVNGVWKCQITDTSSVWWWSNPSWKSTYRETLPFSPPFLVLSIPIQMFWRDPFLSWFCFYAAIWNLEAEDCENEKVQRERDSLLFVWVKTCLHHPELAWACPHPCSTLKQIQWLCFHFVISGKCDEHCTRKVLAFCSYCSYINFSRKICDQFKISPQACCWLIMHYLMNTLPISSFEPHKMQTLMFK